MFFKQSFPFVDARNPRVLRDGRILLDVQFADSQPGVYEVYVANANDVEAAGRRVHKAAKSGKFGELTPYLGQAKAEGSE